MGTISEGLPSAPLVSLCTSVRVKKAPYSPIIVLTIPLAGFGNLGGVISGFAYRSSEAPRFYSGHGLLIGTITMSTILSLFMHLYLVRENKRRDAFTQSKGLTLDDYTEDMKEAERELGDNASVSAVPLLPPHSVSLTLTFLQFFRYTV